MDITALTHPVLTHSVSPTDVDAVFNSDEAGIFTGAIVFVRTDAGSTYQVTLTGPTVTIIRDNKPIRVRKARYIRTTDSQKYPRTFEKYVGFSDKEAPQLLFLSFDEEDDDEHTRMSAPMSSQLRPDMEVVFAL